MSVRCVACKTHCLDDEVDEVTRCDGDGWLPRRECHNGIHLFCGQRGSAWSHAAGPYTSWQCATCVQRVTVASEIRNGNYAAVAGRAALRLAVAVIPELVDGDDEMPELVAHVDTDDESTVILGDSDDELPPLVGQNDGPQFVRPIHHVLMVVSDLPDPRIHVQMAKGILDSNLHDVCSAIGHVVNCIELRPGGLAAAVQRTLPYGDVYANRKPSTHDPTIAGIGAGRLGNIAVRTPAVRGSRSS